ncbi:MAG: MFS transporter [Rickettsiaceae bacterium]|nr:MFS transporter [Rickettsiaceae bacterium]
MKSEETNKFIPLLIWSCITLFYCYQSILRPLPNIIMPDILSKYNIGASDFGSFAGIYYIGYIAVHIPVGLLLSRFGAKKILPICVAFSSIGLIPMIYFDSWWSVVIGRVMTGMGSSAAAVGALQIFRILYPTKFTMMLGAMVSIGLIVAVYASNFMSSVIISIGLSSTLSALLYIGMMLSAATYFLLPSDASETSDNNIWADIKSIIFNYKLLFASLFAGLMVGAFEGFADAWGSAFLISVYGLDKVVADSIALSIFLGMCAGCIILPYIADKTGWFFGITILSGLMLTACFIYLLSGKATIDSLYYVCVTIGIFCAYQVVMLAKISTFVSEERSGMAAAVANMIIMIFGWFFHNSIGRTLESLWDGVIIDGVKQYSASAFTISISIIPISSIFAVIGFAIIVMGIAVQARNIKNAQKNIS